MFRIITISTLCLFLLTTVSFSFAHERIYPKKYLEYRDKVYSYISSIEEDTLKKKATDFLLVNMYERKTKACNCLDMLFCQIDSINNTEKYPQSMNSIYSAIDSFYTEYDMPHNVYEYELVKPEEVAANINEAFQLWNDTSYSRHISFNDYCEYILPPIIGNEHYTPWRKLYRERYAGSLERLTYSDDRNCSPYYAVSKINYQIRHEGVNIKMIDLPFDMNYPADVLLNLKVGACRDFAFKAAYAMRSIGVPVAIDFIPQWPNRGGGHFWNSVISDYGKTIPFTGGGADPSYGFYPDQPMGKVYRMTYSIQEKSLPEIAKIFRNEVIPYTLNNPCIKDVTSEYVKTTTIDIPIPSEIKDKHIAYLAVFDNQEWIPVDYSLIDLNKATFNNMGIGVVYLPCFWSNKRKVESFASPIEVNCNGIIKKLEPDLGKRQTITLKRKFPILSGILGYSERMIGGYVEASNDKDFNNAVKMGEISRFPAMYWDTIKVNHTKEKYRYWRYVSPKAGWCDIAEAEFLFNGKELKDGEIIANVFRKDDFAPKSAFDKDPLTYYESNRANIGWIGLDFGKPVCVDTFRYLPRNDDNHVVVGHEYELEVYVKGKPQSLGKCKATADYVTFENVPIGGLYILHDRTKGTEERIFTYDKGKVKWY